MISPALNTSDLLARTEELARKALQHWNGGSGRLVLLKHRENAVFRAALADGRATALRVHRLSYHTDAALLSELQWMAYLQANGFPTPSPYPARDGSRFVRVATPEMSEGRQVDCLSWVEGRPLGRSGMPLDFGPAEAARIFSVLGATVARMHSFTAAWSRPADFVRHSWDFDGFFGPQPLWGDFEHSSLLSPDAREKISLARLKAMGELASYEKSERTFGLIHADLVRENLLLDDGRVQVIDYDDCGFGWHMYDIAVALYQNLEELHYPVMRNALLSGYASLRPLESKDVEALPLFLTLRAFALIGWMQSRSDNETSRSAGAAACARAVRVATSYLENA